MDRLAEPTRPDTRIDKEMKDHRLMRKWIGSVDTKSAIFTRQSKICP